MTLDLHLIYRSMDKMNGNWSGGDPEEQEDAANGKMKDFLGRICIEFRAMLEYKFIYRRWSIR